MCKRVPILAGILVVLCAVAPVSAQSVKDLEDSVGVFHTNPTSENKKAMDDLAQFARDLKSAVEAYEVNPTPENQKAMQKLQDQNTRRVQDKDMAIVDKQEFMLSMALKMYAQASDRCDSLNIKVAVKFAMGLAFNSRNVYLPERRQEMRVNAARGLNALGDEASAKNCAAVARRAYMSVIDTFTGDSYEAYRQHAMVGIESLPH